MQRVNTLLDYSLALVKLFYKLGKRQPNLTALMDDTLKGRFAAVVRDLNRQREMRRLKHVLLGTPRQGFILVGEGNSEGDLTECR